MYIYDIYTLCVISTNIYYKSTCLKPLSADARAYI